MNHFLWHAAKETDISWKALWTRCLILYGREKSSPAFRIQPEISEQLTSRQIEIINLVWERKKVTSEEIRNKYKITRETANQDFTKLVSLALLVRKGTDRATYYVLGKL